MESAKKFWGPFPDLVPDLCSWSWLQVGHAVGSRFALVPVRVEYKQKQEKKKRRTFISFSDQAQATKHVTVIYLHFDVILHFREEREAEIKVER